MVDMIKDIVIIIASTLGGIKTYQDLKDRRKNNKKKKKRSKPSNKKKKKR
ncbi:hypothetical protein [Cytobacillus sp. IB215665]|nr:hypothetical protein [Cytobacillus sp. IB215665]MDX8367801.1 hypothetical protein [Cytobacillus sp. IB215665]